MTKEENERKLGYSERAQSQRARRMLRRLRRRSRWDVDSAERVRLLDRKGRELAGDND